MVSFNSKIQPFIIFDGCAEQAISTYVDLFPKSAIETIKHWGAGAPFAEGTVQYAGFSLCGLNIMAMDAGPSFQKTDAISLFVHCKDQEEVDKYYDFFAAEGQAKQCGWVTDKFGLSWQIIPLQFNQMMATGKPQQLQAVLQAMMGMRKMIVADLQLAFDAAVS
jgi:predicted 3-demethylubiquinone-9 3-methyltransferase (glyoxalase superfamily)